MDFRRPFGQTQKKPERERVKSCKRIIKRDDQGRIVREEFIGCNKDEIKMFRDGDEKDN